jgi:Raf kinase inhibitor-like YbhB/YbcL family protein
MPGLQLRSSAFNDHDLMPDRLSMLAGNISPPLSWSGVPDDTAELVLLVEDPDGGQPPFVHWLVTGVDPGTSGVPEGGVPARGQQWANGFGDTGWTGPRPPKGDPPHRYFFRLYAVDGPIRLPQAPTAADVHKAVTGHERASGTLVGTFAR